MKKIFTFFALLAAMSLSASNINLHLTGCTSNEGNPTTYTDEDDYAELYFTAESGYTTEGWEVTVKYGETVLPVNDYGSMIGYVYPDAGMGYVFFIWYGDLEEDFDVTIVCKEDTGLPVRSLRPSRQLRLRRQPSHWRQITFIARHRLS